MRSATRRLLARHEIDDVTLRAIAVEAGLAASNVLRHVGSREELLLDLMDEEYRAWLAELSRLTTAPGPGADTTALASLIADTLAPRPLLQCLIEVSPQLLRTLPATRAPERSRGQGLRNGEALADVVQLGLGKQFSAVDRVYLVAGLHAVVTATAAWSRQGVFPVSVPVATRDLVQILLDGLLARADRE
ncbi:TetR/AcrR family transcriptional regulator [Mycolicibacterium sp. P9-22]|uniref:TetR/AcrR family transcriptional regulator n=1 Tax=Mycolicibacterium sp. P9-22 TaxID=2024613 RepID=UPI001D13329C|nr:TetR/AcrR family transcriptional regulator [Mycolicibacterium sp. P9-22]